MLVSVIQLGTPVDWPFLATLKPVLCFNLASFLLLQFARARQLFASSWECQFIVGNCLGVKLEVIYKPRILTVSKPLYINKICSAEKKKAFVILGVATISQLEKHPFCSLFLKECPLGCAFPCAAFNLPSHRLVFGFLDSLSLQP